ncbi:type VI secretion system baseplate subunit TssK, partial [Psychrobacter sp. 1U2]|uniref:type VI secretion system baseplate subunit TssK n=1 Tax=Psychrobacter sp. 1U2 TaxID=3453577 RepID=UPI003F4582DE
MSKHRVLWGEGLFLRPQHFQIQDTYHNSQRALSMMLMQPYAYGVSDVQIDKQLLESNLLSFQSIYAVLPDGTIYQAPRIDALPKGITLDSQDHGDEVFVFLSLEIVHNDSNNIQTEHSDNPARYVRGAIEAKDLYSQAAEAVIDVIKLSPSLQLSHSAQAPSQDTLSLLAIKLVRTTQCIYQVDEDYIVPSVH